MIRVLATSGLIILSLLLPSLPKAISTAQASEESDNDYVLTAPQPIHTTSRFEIKLVSDVEVLPRDTVIKNDPDKELDDDSVVDEGKDGKKTTIIKVSYYEGKEYSREIVSTEVIAPQDKVIDHGTKIVWRTLDTPDGQISYWRKIRVWATQYDSHCPGCDEWTATGMHQGKGVIAVDPSVVKLGSKLYIPGYGPAIAGDTGGAIKGDIIDVGFDDAKTSGWYSHFVDIYLE